MYFVPKNRLTRAKLTFLTGIIFRQINVLIELFREGSINEDYMEQPNGNSTLCTANVLLTSIYDMWLNAKLVHFSSTFLQSG